jgi:ribosome recycling factor
MATPIDFAKPQFQQVVDHFEKELKGMRTGRASSSTVEDIKVEAYGSMMELKGVASISIPDAKTIQIEPWDKNVIKDIEKALVNASLGMQPNVVGTIIRMVMPPMTEQNRKEMVKVLNQKGEQARISIRNVREESRDAISKQEEAKTISEDEKFRLFEQLDTVVKEMNAKIETMVKEKEEELMTI